MKKQILKLSMAIAVIALIFSSCKKGENDPFISLKSRTSRLANKWELSAEDYTSTSTNSGYTSTSKYSYASGIETVTYTNSYNGNSTTSTNTKSLTQEITFEKDGTFSMSINDDGDIESYEGNWAWLGKNKNADLANKEVVGLSITKSTSGSDVENYSGKSNSWDEYLVLDKLSSSELVVLYDYSSTDSDGNTYTKKGTVTYTKK